MPVIVADVVNRRPDTEMEYVVVQRWRIPRMRTATARPIVERRGTTRLSPRTTRSI